MAFIKCVAIFLLFTVSLSSCSTYSSYINPGSSSMTVKVYNGDTMPGMMTGASTIQSPNSWRGFYRLSELRRMFPDIFTIFRDIVLLVLQSLGLLEDNRLYRLHGIAQGIGQLLDDFDVTVLKIKHNFNEVFEFIFSFPILRPIKALLYIPHAILKFIFNIPSKIKDLIKTYITFFVFGTY